MCKIKRQWDRSACNELYKEHVACTCFWNIYTLLLEAQTEIKVYNMELFVSAEQAT